MIEHQLGSSQGSSLFGDGQIREYLDMARRRKWWIILTGMLISLSIAVVAFRLPNIYRSETVIMVDPQQVPSNYVASTVSTGIQDRLSTIQQQVMSPTRLKRIIDTLGLYSEWRGKRSDQELIEFMQKATTIEVVNPGPRGLSAFRISFHGKSPEEAARVANELASIFIKENLKVREEQFTGTADFLTEELRSVKAQLQVKEAELGVVKSQNILDLPESKQYHLEALTNMRNQLQVSQDRVARLQQDKILLQSISLNNAPTIDVDSVGPTQASSPYMTQIQKLETRLADLQSRYGPSYPEVRKVQAELQQLRAKAGQEENPKLAQSQPLLSDPESRGRRNPVLIAQAQKLDQEIEEQTRQQAKLQEQINFHVSKLERVPVFEQKIAGLMRDYDVLNVQYHSLLDKKLAAEMASELENRQQGERFVVLDPAPIPERPFGPNRLLIIAAGLLGGLLGGFGLAIMAEMTDESVRSEREAEQILGKPVLVGVPRVATPHERRLRRLRALGALAGTAACAIVIGVVLSRFIG